MRAHLLLALTLAPLVAGAGDDAPPAPGQAVVLLPGLDLAPVPVEGRFTDQGGGGELCFEPLDAGQGFCLDDPPRARGLLGLPAELPAGACRLTGRARVEVMGWSPAPTGAPAAGADEIEARPALVRVLWSALDPPPAEPPRALGPREGVAVALDVPLAAAGVAVGPGDLARAAAHRLSRGLLDAARGAFLFDLAAAPGPRLLRVDPAGVAWPAPLPVPDPRPGERVVPAALGWVGGVPAALLLRVARGEPPRAALVALDGPGAPRLLRALEPVAPALRALVLPDGAVLAEAGTGEAAAWWLYPAAGAPRRLALPAGAGPAAVVGGVALLLLPEGLMAVDGAGGIRPVRGCEPCADPGAGALVGGPGDRFGCLGRDPAPLPDGREGWRRRLTVCRLGPGGEAALVGERALEPALRYGDACHLRWPVQGPGVLDAAGGYRELEVGVAEAPRLRVVVYAPPPAP